MPKVSPKQQPTAKKTELDNTARSKRFLMGVDMQPYQDFCLEVIGIKFKDLELLLNCFTHRSYVNEHRKAQFKNNERLEFLGDAVLELAVTEYLFTNHPDQPEGILTAWRSALVRTESIGEVATKLKMDELLRVSKGEKLDLARSKLQIMANTFEAFVGSIYLEFDFQTAVQFIQKYLLIRLNGIIDDQSWKDPKSVLQEQVQAQYSVAPVYKLISEEGPDHDKIFKIGVYVDGQKFGEGSGHSKQVAQQEAARQAITKLKSI